jgi:hypothetical protein
MGSEGPFGERFSQSGACTIKPWLVFGTAGSTPGICCTFCRGQEMPHFIPRGPATPVNDFKESRTQLDNATNLGRKSGVPGTMMNCFPMLSH